MSRARELVDAYRQALLFLSSGSRDERTALLAHIAKLEAVATAARDHDRAVAAQERFSCDHYEPPCACAKAARKLDEHAEETGQAMRAALTALDAAEEGGGEK